MKKLAILFTLIFVMTGSKAIAADRIVSVGGANTEIIFALDAGDKVIATDTSSYYPAVVKSLPKVGYQRTLSAEGILSFSPDLVILPDSAGPEASIKQIQESGVNTIILPEAKSTDDLLNNIKKVSQAIDKKSAFIASEVIEEMNLLKEHVKTHHANTSIMFIMRHGNVAMVAGQNTAADSMISLAGFQNAVTEFSGYKPLTPEAALSINPDVILTSTEDMSQKTEIISAVKNMPGVSMTEAAKNEHIIVMDTLYLLGFGPRTAKAALDLHAETEKLTQ